MAICLIPTARVIPAGVRIDPVQAAVVEQMFAWYTDPGHATKLVCRWPSASAMPRFPRPGAANAGMSPRYGAFCARRPIREWPIVAGPAPRLPAVANPPCSRWGLARVSSQPQPRSGLPCRCQPSSARRPSKRPSTAWIVTCKWPAATIRPMSIYSAAWSVVASVDSRAVVAPCTPATIITSAGVVPMRCGWPSASAARRAMPPRRPWTTWCGRISAVS